MDIEQAYFRERARRRLGGTFLRLAWLAAALSWLAVIFAGLAIAYQFFLVVYILILVLAMIATLFILLASERFRSMLKFGQTDFLRLYADFRAWYLPWMWAFAALGAAFAAGAFAIAVRDGGFRSRRRAVSAIFALVAIALGVTLTLCVRPGGSGA